MNGMEISGDYRIKICIVGLGNMGSAHASCIFSGAVDGMVLAAVCDTDPERLREAERLFPGVPVFSSHSEAFDSGVADAALIATPHYSHTSIACDAFTAGLHVMCEKPAGVYTGQVKEMNLAARRSGKVFGIMFNQRTNPLFARAREIVHSGQLGIPKRLVWIVTNWYRTQAYYDSSGWRATWDGEGGGVLINQAPHNIDLVQWIFGLPSSVYAVCHTGKYHTIEVEDDAAIYMDYKNGASAVFITSTGEYPGTNRLEITGDRGKLVLEHGVLTHTSLEVPEREVCFSEKGFSPSIPMKTTEYRQDTPETGHAGILADFVRAVSSGKPLLAPGTDGIAELSISNAAYLSSWTSNPVSLPLSAEDEKLFETLLNERCAQSPKNRDATSDTHTEYSRRWQVTW